MELRTLDLLLQARRLANFAEGLGFSPAVQRRPKLQEHVGALLADAILQAGVNYKNVVQPRVERIISGFPEAATLSGAMPVIASNKVDEFLSWKHPEKIARFVGLFHLLHAEGVDDANDLAIWLKAVTGRSQMIRIKGIGPKTVDYLSCLVGIDSLAVDRHVRSFAKRAGIDSSEYELLRSVFCCAADLLGSSRRDFDAWIWATQSRGSKYSEQYILL